MKYYYFERQGKIFNMVEKTTDKNKLLEKGVKKITKKEYIERTRNFEEIANI